MSEMETLVGRPPRRDPRPHRLGADGASYDFAKQAFLIPGDDISIEGSIPFNSELLESLLRALNLGQGFGHGRAHFRRRLQNGYEEVFIQEIISGEGVLTAHFPFADLQRLVSASYQT